MSKAAKRAFVCQSCGAVATRWVGKCASCGDWNTLAEETSAHPQLSSGPRSAGRGRAVELESLAGESEPRARLATGQAEFDRVAGGGIVPGSALLIGGEPGIGKSTLLLQVAAAVASAGGSALYFSGEESVDQVRLRARRLGLAAAPVALASETNLANILSTMTGGATPDLVVVDSIQTLWAETLDAAPGTVTQVRTATQALIRFAKTQGCALLLVGHVTKDGQIAGPKVIEHMVDTVLYFEGDRGLPYRILRAVKNRFGATDEIGVFEMAAQGLRGVANPSELFMGNREVDSPGTAVFAGVEGTRPILVELQALVAPTALGTPRRAVVGWDANRLSMLLAVFEARCGVSFAQHDVYLNVAGGLKITEPAADLAAAAALISSLSGVPLPIGNIYFGEISLSGSLRASGHASTRLKEAQKLGFTGAAIPLAGDIDGASSALKLSRVAHLKELAAAVLPCD